MSVRLSTGSPTGNFRPFAQALVQAYAETLPDVHIALIDTPGSVQNLEELEEGTVDLGLAQAGIAYMAYNGRLPDRTVPLRNLRGIAVLNSSFVQVLVAPRSQIASIGELQGRRIGTGAIGSGSAVAAEVLFGGLFKPGEVQQLDLTAVQSSERLIAGQLDAVFFLSGIPTSGVHWATQAGARILPIRGTAIDRLRANYPFLRSDIIPGGMYPGHPAPIHTLSVDVVLLARAGLDEALVRRLTSGLFHVLPRLSARLDFLRGMVTERAPATPVPLHRGAALFYREKELSQ